MTRMMVKMAAGTAIAVLFLCCSAVTAAGSQDCNINVATNENTTVPLNHALRVSDHLKWKRGDETIFYRRGTHIHKGTASDVDQNGSLKLTKVTKDKAGEYTPEVHDGISGMAVNGLKKTRLCVLDRVPKPEVKIDCSSSSNVKFTCGVPKGTKDVSFEWLQDNKVVDKGQTLQKKISDDVKKATFTCRVSNPVSNWTSSPVTQNCTKGIFDFFPKEVLGINTWIFVGGGGGVVLILIIIVIACCIRNKRRQRLQIKDEEELRLGWTNSNQQHQHHHQHNHPPNQHHHHPHHHHQQQPAGHTGPRQHRSKQQRGQQHPRDTNNPNGQPQPSPRRPAQAPRPPVDDGDEVPPPLPQPRKKAPKTPRA